MRYCIFVRLTGGPKRQKAYLLYSFTRLQVSVDGEMRKGKERERENYCYHFTFASLNTLSDNSFLYFSNMSSLLCGLEIYKKDIFRER